MWRKGVYLVHLLLFAGAYLAKLMISRSKQAKKAELFDPTFVLCYHFEQGLAARKVAVEDLFAPETLDEFKI